MRKFTLKACTMLLVLFAQFNVVAQTININLNQPRQGIDGVGFCHEGDRQNGNYYVISPSIQQMLDNRMTLFRDMFPNRTFAISRGNYNYSDQRVVNSFLRLKEMQNRGIKTILGIWDMPNWLVSNPWESSRRKINNYDDFADVVTAFLVHGKNNYGLRVDFIDINETRTSGVNLDLTAQEYVTFMQKCQTRFTANGLQTKVNIGSVLLWDLQYNKDIYNAVRNLSVAGYPSWHTYRGGSLKGEQREPISYWEGWGAWQQTLDRNLWGTETDYDAYYWREMNPDVDRWTGAQEMAVMYYRNYYVARLSTSAGWFWHQEYPSHNVHIAYMNHFEPGGQVVETSQPDPTVMTVAYKHVANGKFVIQVLNESSSSKTVTFAGVPGGQPLTLIRTSEAGDRYRTIGTYTPSGSNFTITLQANSFNTFTGNLGVTDTQAPSVPANFASTGKTSTTISLTWNASTDNVAVAGYQVFNSSNVLLGSSTTPGMTLQNLTPATTYTMVVKAYDASGNFSGASNSVTVTTNSTPASVATVYGDCNLAGPAVGLGTGSYTLAQLQALGIANDNISSLRVQSGYRVTLFADSNLNGASASFTSDDVCLVDNNFNDLTSSITVSAVSPAIVIQAENYNNMSGVTRETCTDTGGGQNLGSMDLNDWVVYDNINIPSSGSYTVQYRVASLNGGAQFQLERGGGSVIYGTVTVPQTGGWQNWTTIQHNVNLTAGVQSFGIKVRASGGNLNWFSIAPASGARVIATHESKTIESAGMKKVSGSVGVYPSPATDVININTGTNNGTSLVEIRTIQGALLYKGKIDGATGVVDVSHLHYSGNAIIRVINNEKTSVLKISIK